MGNQGGSCDDGGTERAMGDKDSSDDDDDGEVDATLMAATARVADVAILRDIGMGACERFNNRDGGDGSHDNDNATTTKIPPPDVRWRAFPPISRRTGFNNNIIITRHNNIIIIHDEHHYFHLSPCIRRESGTV